MFAIDVPGAAPALPASSPPGVAGFFTDGDLLQNQPPTIVPAEFMNSLMLELLAIVQAGGIVPAKGVNNQAAASIAAMIKAVRLDVQNNALVYAQDTGVANACRVAYTPAVVALSDGEVLAFQALASNTGPVTFSPNGLPARPVLGAAHVPLQGGEIVATGKCFVMWHAPANSWILLQATGGAVQVGAATNAAHAVPLGQFNAALPTKSFIYYMANL